MRKLQYSLCIQSIYFYSVGWRNAFISIFLLLTLSSSWQIFLYSKTEMLTFLSGSVCSTSNLFMCNYIEVKRLNAFKTKILTCELLMTWLASSWIVNVTPSSDEKDFIGDKVPDVKTIVHTLPLISEKA